MRDTRPCQAFNESETLPKKQKTIFDVTDSPIRYPTVSFNKSTSNYNYSDQHSAFSGQQELQRSPLDGSRLTGRAAVPD